MASRATGFQKQYLPDQFEKFVERTCYFVNAGNMIILHGMNKTVKTIQRSGIIHVSGYMRQSVMRQEGYRKIAKST